MTHKCHEKQREIEARRARMARTASVLLSALSSTGVVTILVTQDPWAQWATAIITFLGLFANLWILQFTPDQRAADHKEAAAQYLLLRNKARTAGADYKLDPSATSAKAILQELDARSSELAARYPSTSPGAATQARLELT